MFSTTKRRSQLVLALSFIVSAAGILVSAYLTHNAADGGRGGAVAVAISFATLFLGRDLGSRLYAILTKEAPEARKILASLGEAEPTGPVNADKRIDALIAKTTIESHVLSTQNAYLAASSVIGTLIWAFGDLIAAALMPAH